MVPNTSDGLDEFLKSSTVESVSPQQGRNSIQLDASGKLEPCREPREPVGIPHRTQGYGRRWSMCVSAEDAVAHEPWRDSEAGRRALGVCGGKVLRDAMDEQYLVVPRSAPGQKAIPGREFPVLGVSPVELFRHVIASFESGRWSRDSPRVARQGVFVEVFGGLASKALLADVMAAEDLEGGEGGASNRPPEPTDLDARFYIANSSSFDACRAMVEEYLLLKLLQTLAPDSPLREVVTQPSMLRFVYFQKQAVVQDAFSLLSIGDAASGRNIDLEFAVLGNGVRKYFDEAYACVIPLTLEQLARMNKVHAFAQSGDMKEMLALMRSRVLCVNNPEEVVNGLTLYAHAICDKGQWPSDTREESHLGMAFVGALMQQGSRLLGQRQDPIRFVRSFLRSHYSARPLQALVTLCQMLVEISAYVAADTDADTTPRDAVVRANVCEQLAGAVADSLVAALQRHATTSELSDALRIVRFLVQPCITADADEGDANEPPPPSARVHVLASPGGHDVYAMRKACAVDTSGVCGLVVARLAASGGGARRWVGCVLEAVVGMLQSHEEGGFGESESLGHMLKMLQAGGEGDLACSLFVGKRGLWRAMTREHTLFLAQALLEDCPTDRAAALAGLIARSCGQGHVHQTAKEAIKRLRARRAVLTAKGAGAKGVVELDQAIYKLLTKIPQTPMTKRPAERSPPRDPTGEPECEPPPLSQDASGGAGRSKRIAFMGPGSPASPERIRGPERGLSPSCGESTCSDSTEEPCASCASQSGASRASSSEDSVVHE